jgi:cellulose biosynthesis protein BcsQ
MVGKLKEIQWEKIITSATALAKQKKVVMIDVDALSSSDSSLVDGDEDLQVKVEESPTLQEEDENGSDIYY